MCVLLDMFGLLLDMFDNATGCAQSWVDETSSCNWPRTSGWRCGAYKRLQICCLGRVYVPRVEA